MRRKKDDNQVSRLIAEKENLIERLDYRNQSYIKLYEENNQLKQELKTRREETNNLEAKLSAQLSMKRDLEKENEQLQKQLEIYKKGYEKAHEGWFKYRELKSHIFSLADRSFFNRKYMKLLHYIIYDLDEEGK